MDGMIPSYVWLERYIERESWRQREELWHGGAGGGNWHAKMVDEEWWQPLERNGEELEGVGERRVGVDEMDEVVGTWRGMGWSDGDSGERQ